MSRSKDIGTRGETALVKHAREHGYPLADRRPLKGNNDEGDVLLAPGLIAEVKSGKTAQNASYNQILTWMAEAETERQNANADIALLVVQRRGYGIGRPEMWQCWLTYRFGDEGAVEAVLCMTTRDALLLCRQIGYGNPLT